MNRRWVILWSFVAGILFSLFVPILILATGAINIGADMKPSAVERRVASWARDKSVSSHATQEKNPLAGDSAAVATGLTDYRENCVVCHGAPGVDPTTISQGLNPHAPSLAKESDASDGELFWVAKHGIRLTPMPAFSSTHSDEEIWKLVAFIRHIPNLTDHERASLGTLTPVKKKS